MGVVVAIGGGQIGRPGTEIPVETTEIDQEIIRLSGKSHPKLLFVPTASSDAESYCSAVRQHFGKRLGCTVNILYLIKNQQTKKGIEEKVLSSDIIYVGGGNTLKMLIEWRRRGVDKILVKAFENNIILSGLSAGAICWFKYGSSDSRRFNNPDAGLIKIRGLKIINALCCPHYDTERDRKEHLKVLMRKTSGVGIALDSCSAIECVDDKYRIITSKGTATAFKVYWREGQFYEEIIEKRNVFRPLVSLLTK
jgi:dipeptidase E